MNILMSRIYKYTQRLSKSCLSDIKVKQPIPLLPKQIILAVLEGKVTEFVILRNI